VRGAARARTVVGVAPAAASAGGCRSPARPGTPPPATRGDYPTTRFFVGAQLPTETDQYYCTARRAAR